jgi:hypothetical protein
LLDQHPAVAPIQFEAQFGDPVTTLWFIPITEKEASLARKQGTDALLPKLPKDRWKDA